ncbi:uncharacterized protein [Ptychodera flava]|uniref:uncharacterized protein n=1 Tax=Ptychodera flava TaxID=63121 RepID=UPI003969D492
MLRSLKMHCTDRLSLLVEETKNLEEKEKLDDEEVKITDLMAAVGDCVGELTALENSIHVKQMTVQSSLAKQMERLVEIQMQTQFQTQKLLEAQEQQLERHSYPSGELQSESAVPSPVSVKLPKLDLVSFSGDVLAWKEFWDSFECTIHQNSHLSRIEKFNYLRSKLHGDALNAISGMTPSNENYDVAVRLLCERFGDNQTVINAHYSKLISLTVSANQAGSLRTLYDGIEKHLRSLEAIGQDVNQDIFVSIITSKLPKEVLFQLEL